MKNSVLKILDRSFSGLLWITNSIPSYKDDYFNTVDYILNGLMRKNSLADNKKVNIFFTESFGEPFFVIHMVKSEDIYERLNQVLSNLKKQILPNSKVLYISEDNTHSKKILSILSSVVKIKGITFNQTHV